jgi:hypothetical protein
MLVDRGEKNVTSFKLTKYDLATAYLHTLVLFVFIDRDANMNNSSAQKRTYASTGFRAWNKKGMILMPSSDHGRNLTSLLVRATLTP